MNKSIYEQLAELPYLTAYRRLIEGAIELDVFSQLETPITAAELAEKMKWHPCNTLHLLRGLTSIGFIRLERDAFVNTADASKYLVKSSPYYMGDTLLFFGSNNGMALEGVKEQVQNGPVQMPEVQQSLDFAAYGALMRQAQSGIRQREVIDLVRSLPENDRILRILDLGCGAGMLGVALVQDMPVRNAVLYDQPPMQPLIDESIVINGIREQAVSMAGDFLTDDIGSGYDLILCSSIMAFAIKGGAAFFAKLKAALNPGGVVLCMNEGIEKDGCGPWDMVLGYMTYNMQGIPMGLEKGKLAEAAMAGGFSSVENQTMLLSTGTHDINILR